MNPGPEAIIETTTTNCEACGEGLREGFRYCPACGAAAGSEGGLSCPACGLIQPEEVVFCSRCGAHLGSLGRAERRVVTVLFADLSGFTRITERLDPEAVHELVASCLEPLADCAIRWGGHVDKFIGDSVMALFGVPEGHENEPERAVRAALEMHRTLAAWSPADRHSLELTEESRPKLSVGINTGPVVTGLLSAGSACDYTALGDVVNVASRLESACEPGGVLVGDRTWRETRDVFEFDEGEVMEVPGRGEPVRVRRVLGERGGRRGDPSAADRARPLVGRGRELERLRAAWASAREGETERVLVVGEPGVGKTRLLEELVASEGLGDEDVGHAVARAHGRRRPWELAASLVTELHGLPRDAAPEDGAEEVAAGHPGGWSGEERRDLTSALAGEEPPDGGDDAPRAAVLAKALGEPDGPPRLLLLDNLHWADRPTLDWLAAGAPGLSGPRLLVAVTRPPLPHETGLRDVLHGPLPRLDVEPLGPEESRTLLGSILGDHDLPEAFVDRVLGRTKGNPFFLEDLLASLDRRGAVERRDGRWRLVEEPERLGVPDGVESLLSTRMDALPPTTKRLLQCASVVGRRFWAGLLADELLERPVDEDLERLMAAGMIRPASDPRIPTEREYVFEHVLLREVAYETLLRSVRAELHGSVASWLEELPADAVAGYHALAAYHWQRSEEPGRAEAHRAARAGAEEAGT